MKIFGWEITAKRSQAPQLEPSETNEEVRERMAQEIARKVIKAHKEAGKPDPVCFIKHERDMGCMATIRREAGDVSITSNTGPLLARISELLQAAHYHVVDDHTLSDEVILGAPR